jgi:hypothetical protein
MARREAVEESSARSLEEPETNEPDSHITTRPHEK